MANHNGNIQAPDVLAYMANRGIGAETVERYQITGIVHAGRPALQYPAYNGSTYGVRIKYTDGDKPKNKWKTSRPDGLLYYSPGNLSSVFKRGILWGLNGEPAVWALHSYLVKRGGNKETPAFGISWFGENIIPASLTDDLRAWGIKKFIVPLDTDSHGYSMGKRLLEDYDWNGIDLMMVKLPFSDVTEDNGLDFNDLWIETGLDPVKMDSAISALLPISYDEIIAGLALFKPDNAPSDTPKQNTLEEGFRGGSSGNSDRKGSNTLDAKKVFEDWVELIISSLGSPKKEGKYLRYHCPVHPSMGRGEDKHPSLRIDTDKPTARPYCSCNIHNEDKAWDKIAVAVGKPTWDEYKIMRGLEARKSKTEAQKAERKQELDERRELTVIPAKAAMRDVLKLAAGDVSGMGNPVIMPLKALHHMGGLCRVIQSGKLVGQFGGSGEFKTQLVETQADYQNRMGQGNILCCPEWTPVEMQLRRIQRYSGESYWDDNAKMFITTPHITVEKMTLWSLWNKEAQLGIPPDHRMGVALTPDELDEIERVSNLTMSWLGQSYYLYENPKIDENLYLEDMLVYIADTFADCRRRGERVDSAYIDYLGVVEMREAPKNKKEDATVAVIKEIKRHSIKHQYVGFCVNQVTKSAAKEQRGGERLLDASDAFWVRDDMFNLILTLNRKYIEVMNYWDKTKGKRIRKFEPTNKSVIHAVKNSLGTNMQSVELEIDLDHLIWLDSA